MATVIENNGIPCWTYCVIIGYCGSSAELFMIKFTALNLNYKWVFKAIAHKLLFSS